ncbi:hypothetical protein CVT25_007475 [Psilocybe cyanescens]|uniref:Uncharacterized protein n=1 Tax=Psilocybe cyanescens TaxID=93625 RepID=A0A409XVQ9_PSICY|nr:hypothetical protein CVT25_007475 [Psilocybe cyanescens]
MVFIDHAIGRYDCSHPFDVSTSTVLWDLRRTLQRSINVFRILSVTRQNEAYLPRRYADTVTAFSRGRSSEIEVDEWHNIPIPTRDAIPRYYKEWVELGHSKEEFPLELDPLTAEQVKGVENCLGNVFPLFKHKTVCDAKQPDGSQKAHDLPHAQFLPYIWLQQRQMTVKLTWEHSIAREKYPFSKLLSALIFNYRWRCDSEQAMGVYKVIGERIYGLLNHTLFSSILALCASTGTQTERFTRDPGWDSCPSFGSHGQARRTVLTWDNLLGIELSAAAIHAPKCLFNPRSMFEYLDADGALHEDQRPRRPLQMLRAMYEGNKKAAKDIRRQIITAV